MKLIIPVIAGVALLGFVLWHFASIGAFEPEFLQQCIRSENKTFYTSPTYICTMYLESGGCGMMIPVGGGVPYEKEVCLEHKDIKNPNWRKR